MDMLKLIQLGLTLTDGEGNLPMIGNHYCMWQFNFREFSLKEDMYAQDSIALLKQSGIDFKAHEERGIDVHRFGELLMVSGVVLSSKVKWVTFHSGYDFGYLVKLLTCRPLPATEAEFFHILGLYLRSGAPKRNAASPRSPLTFKDSTMAITRCDMVRPHGGPRAFVGKMLGQQGMARR